MPKKSCALQNRLKGFITTDDAKCSGKYPLCGSHFLFYLEDCLFYCMYIAHTVVVYTSLIYNLL